MPGMGELVIILLIVLVVFGANKLPSIGDALGRSIKNFKRSSKVEDDEKEELEEKQKPSQQLAGKPQKQLEASGEGDDEWERTAAEAFVQGFAESDAIYDHLPM